MVSLQNLFLFLCQNRFLFINFAYLTNLIHIIFIQKYCHPEILTTTGDEPRASQIIDTSHLMSCSLANTIDRTFHQQFLYIFKKHPIITTNLSIKNIQTHYQEIKLTLSLNNGNCKTTKEPQHFQSDWHCEPIVFLIF